MLAKGRSEQLFIVRWRARGAGFQGHRSVGNWFCPASPCPAVHPAPWPPDPPVECPGFGLDRFEITLDICFSANPFVGKQAFPNMLGSSTRRSVATCPWYFWQFVFDRFGKQALNSLFILVEPKKRFLCQIIHQDTTQTSWVAAPGIAAWRVGAK